MRLAQILLAVSLLFVAPMAWAASPQEDLAQADQSLTAAMQALDAGNVDLARQRYQEFRTRWQAIEDGIRDVDADTYQEIETAMRAARQSLAAEPFDAATTRAALDTLHERNEEFYDSAAGAAAVQATSSATDDAGRLRVLVGQLETTRAELSRHDAAGAQRA